MKIEIQILQTAYLRISHFEKKIHKNINYVESLFTSTLPTIDYNLEIQYKTVMTNCRNLDTDHPNHIPTKDNEKGTSQSV